MRVVSRQLLFPLPPPPGGGGSLIVNNDVRIVTEQAMLAHVLLHATDSTHMRSVRPRDSHTRFKFDYQAFLLLVAYLYALTIHLLER